MIIIIALIAVGLVSVGPIMSNVEQPNYEVIFADNNFEIRTYDPVIIAEVVVRGERKAAINDGFKLLADYIFGNNSVNEKVSMTAPVSQKQSEKISMTAPVSQQEVGGEWAVHFIMPSSYNLNTLPKPNNQLVKIKQMPEKSFAVIQFAGSNTNDNLRVHENTLKEYLLKNEIASLSSPVYAFYNPPWTLPFMRRNEVMIEVEASSFHSGK